MPWVAVHTEFVVTTAQILDECVPGTDHSCRTEPFQATHRPQSGFEPSMIGLDGVIGVLLHDMADARQQLVEHNPGRIRWLPALPDPCLTLVTQVMGGSWCLCITVG